MVWANMSVLVASESFQAKKFSGEARSLSVLTHWKFRPSQAIIDKVVKAGKRMNTIVYFLERNLKKKKG
jgi:RecA-family ATPase